MERHRAQIVDAALEGHKTAIREHAAQLDSIYKEMDRIHDEVIERERDIKYLMSEPLVAFKEFVSPGGKLR